MTAIFVPGVAEFEPVWRFAQGLEGVRTIHHPQGWVEISSSGALEFHRKTLGIPHAVWFGLPTGGLEGRIVQFDAELLRVEPIASGDQR